MGVSCQIVRGVEGRLEEVLDPSGNPSKLYGELYNNIGDADVALDVWASAYTEGFSDYAYDVSEVGIEPSVKEIQGYYKNHLMEKVPFRAIDKNEIIKSLSALGGSHWRGISRVYNTLFKNNKFIPSKVTVKDLVDTDVYTEFEAERILTNPDVMSSVSRNIERLYLEYLKEDSFIDDIDSEGDGGLSFRDNSEMDLLGKGKVVTDLEVRKELFGLMQTVETFEEFEDGLQYLPNDVLVDKINTDKEYAKKVFDFYKLTEPASLYLHTDGGVVDTGIKVENRKLSNKNTKLVKLYGNKKSFSKLFKEDGLMPLGNNTFLRVNKFESFEELIENINKLLEKKSFSEVFGSEQTNEDVDEAIADIVEKDFENVARDFSELETEDIARIILYSKIFDVPLQLDKKIADSEFGKIQFLERVDTSLKLDEFRDKILGLKEDLSSYGNDILEGIEDVGGVLMLDSGYSSDLGSRIESVLPTEIVEDLKLYSLLEERSNISDIFSFPVERGITDKQRRVAYKNTPELLEEFRGEYTKKVDGNIEVNSSEQFLNIGGEVYENVGDFYSPIELTEPKKVRSFEITNKFEKGVSVGEIISKKELKEIDDEIDSCR